VTFLTEPHISLLAMQLKIINTAKHDNLKEMVSCSSQWLHISSQDNKTMWYEIDLTGIHNSTNYCSHTSAITSISDITMHNFNSVYKIK